MKNKALMNIFLGVLFLLGFLWVRAFVHLVSFSEKDTIYGGMLVAVFTMGLTLYCYWWLINGVMDGIEAYCDINIKKCASIAGIVSFVLLVALLLEICCSGFSLYGTTSIILWEITISKRYLYDIIAVLVLPLFTEYSFKAMKKENFSLKARLTGTMQIMSFTVGAILFFYAMRNIYLIDLAVISCCTVGAGIGKYVWNHGGVRGCRGDVVAAGLLYVAAWMAVLLLRASGEGVADFMYGGDWSAYIENVQTLMVNASVFGESRELLEMRSVQEWLYNRGNYIHQLFFYGGWAVVILFVGFMVGFLVVLFKMLGLQSFRIHKHQLIYTAAFIVLVNRTVLGLCYSFGLLPYPIALPFAGSHGIVTDCIAFALLIKCTWENHRIGMIRTAQIAIPQDILGEADGYVIVEAEGDIPYLEESVEEEVILKGADNEIKCSAVRYGGDNREYVVLCPKNQNTAVLIMESLGDKTEKWKPVEDNGEQAVLLGKYMQDVLADIVEVEEDAKG